MVRLPNAPSECDPVDVSNQVRHENDRVRVGEGGGVLRWRLFGVPLGRFPFLLFGRVGGNAGRGFMDEVVEPFHLYVGVQRRGSLLPIASKIGVLLVVSISFLNPRCYLRRLPPEQGA